MVRPRSSVGVQRVRQSGKEARKARGRGATNAPPPSGLLRSWCRPALLSTSYSLLWGGCTHVGRRTGASRPGRYLRACHRLALAAGMRQTAELGHVVHSLL